VYCVLFSESQCTGKGKHVPAGILGKEPLCKYKDIKEKHLLM